MYGLIAIPVVALGASYGLGAFTTDSSSLKEDDVPGLTSKTWKNPTALKDVLEEEKSVKADQQLYQASAGRKRKTKKSKSKSKKTKRRR